MLLFALKFFTTLALYVTQGGRIGSWYSLYKVAEPNYVLNIYLW
jgi:hypothetical protein